MAAPELLLTMAMVRPVPVASLISSAAPGVGLRAGNGFDFETGEDSLDSS